MDDKVREIFNRIRETATVAADAAETAARQLGRKTGETLEIAKLNMRIFDLETEIGASQREIGKMVYDTHRGGAADEEKLAEILKDIDEKYDEIEVCKARISGLKSSSVCPRCGEPCGKGDLFCKKCGSPIS